MTNEEIMKYVKELDATAFILDCDPFEVYDKVKALLSQMNMLGSIDIDKPTAEDES